jgi:cell division septation protein DedD
MLRSSAGSCACASHPSRVRPSGRRSSSRFGSTALALLLLAASAVEGSGKPLQLEEAWQLERAGDSAAAARLYLSWARDRAGEPRSLAGIAGFLRTERSFDALVDACRDFVGSMPKLPGSWPLIAESAQLFELAGLDEEAAAAYVEAWSRGGPASLLVRAMRLALAMGDLEAYAAAANRTVTVAGFDPLAATADRLAGRIDEARHVSNGILAAVGDPSARLVAAWNLFEVSRSTGSPADRAQAAERLGMLFPGSPEAVIALAAASAAAPRVLEAPSPSLFFSAVQLPQVQPPVAQPPVTQPPAAQPVTAKTFSIQAGAFQVRENADELIEDLVRSGFAAVIREGTAQGKTVFRVFAATGLDRDGAAQLLERLRVAGYAGFAVAD